MFQTLIRQSKILENVEINDNKTRKFKKKIVVDSDLQKYKNLAQPMLTDIVTLTKRKNE